MPEHGASRYAFMYVETDVPPGMTIAEWRIERARERAEQRAAVLDARRARRRALLAALLRRLRAGARRKPARRQVPA